MQVTRSRESMVAALTMAVNTGFFLQEGAMPPSDRKIAVRFRIAYPTRWGQSLVVTGQGALLGNFNWSAAVPLSCHHEGDTLVWEAQLLLPWKPEYRYKYAVVRTVDDEMKIDKCDQEERVLQLSEFLESGDCVEVCDSWVDLSYAGELLSTPALAQVVFPNRSVPDARRSQAKLELRPTAPGEVVVRFVVYDHMVERGQSLYVTGGIPQLGNWQPDLMLPLIETRPPYWEAEVRVPLGCFQFTYKYALRSTLGLPEVPGGPPHPGTVLLEVGEPRLASLHVPPTTANGPVPHGGLPNGIGPGGGLPGSNSNGSVITSLTLSMLTGGMLDHTLLAGGAPACMVRHDGPFRRDRLWRGAGVAVPVFSLRTQQSLGCGEFLDLVPLVDLADRCGMRLIQLLPVNDTMVYNTWWDSYPYSCLSVHALHPMYVALGALRPNGGPLPADVEKEISECRSALESLPEMDYVAVVELKVRLARRVFDEHGPETLDSEDYKAWLADNIDWLKPYAAFTLLRDTFGTAEHWQWGCLSKPSPEALERLTSPKSEYWPRVQFCYWLQYHLHSQLLQVAQHAKRRRVLLKGDLPIGVDKRSVDTWMAPQLFRMNTSTGAPPDNFAKGGQNWGFPTYNWEAMAKEDFAWWTRRLKVMAQYFSAYRIDHILGFFRIWEIPADCTTGLLGRFRPALPITKQELESRGLWDIERLTQPYIRKSVLKEVFGEDAWEDVAARYCMEYEPGKYRLRPAYSTEAQIEAIPIRPGSPQWLEDEVRAVRKGLLTLRQNVLLLRDPEDEGAFYPRFDLMSTLSYKAMEPHHRAALRHLHDEHLFKRQDELWRESALAKLPALQDASCGMLVCGEDLGLVPGCVPPVMHELGILGLRIQRMPSEPNREFASPATYPYACVASPSCHDVTPLRAWYEGNADMAERFYYGQLGGCGPAPRTCGPDVVRAVLQQHVNCPAMLSVFPLQDLLALSPRYASRPAKEEVINDPTKSKHYWRYRVHVTLEELSDDAEWVGTIQEMLMLGERC